eukprot:TRINITY_DN19953_c1_g1_i1.p1 TRINITY_DN19953_c1_g1~~TRINITY_DN19953_c1_g1_i1.p1  ORF type:complete len:249 (+),score=43.21 TRINITY_DN19953_c1_g1_i1:19-765(+)
MVRMTAKLAGPMSKVFSCGIGKGKPCVCDVLPTLDTVPEGIGTMSRDALEKCMCETIAALDCCATLALPTPLHEDQVNFKAVSLAFANLTENSSSALLSSKLRVLNAGDFPGADLENDAKLRRAVFSGRPCTIVREYRKGSGQLFRALLHLQGLRVAIAFDDAASPSEDGIDGSVWYLLGVYEDVSDLSDDETQERIKGVKHIVDDVRKRIAIALAALEETIPGDGDDVKDTVLAIDPEWIQCVYLSF